MIAQRIPSYFHPQDPAQGPGGRLRLERLKTQRYMVKTSGKWWRHTLRYLVCNVVFMGLIVQDTLTFLVNHGGQSTYINLQSSTLTILFWGLLTIMHIINMYFGRTTNCIWSIQELGFNPRIGMKHPENEDLTILRLIGSWVVFNWGSHIYMDNHWVCLRENSEGNPGFYQLQHVFSVTCPTGVIVGCTLW